MCAWVVFQAPVPVMLDDEETRSPRPMTWGTSRHGRERLRAVRSKTRKKQTPRKMTGRRGRSMDGGLDNRIRDYYLSHEMVVSCNVTVCQCMPLCRVHRVESTAGARYMQKSCN